MARATMPRWARRRVGKMGIRVKGWTRLDTCVCGWEASILSAVLNKSKLELLHISVQQFNSVLPCYPGISTCRTTPVSTTRNKARGCNVTPLFYFPFFVSTAAPRFFFVSPFFATVFPAPPLYLCLSFLSIVAWFREPPPPCQFFAAFPWPIANPHLPHGLLL